MASSTDPPRIPETLWRALAEYRFSIRRFLDFSGRASRREGLLPQQHQVLLEIRAASRPEDTTVGYLADRMFLRHHSVVGLVDRLERKGLVRRERDARDRRRVVVALTPRGQGVLDRLTRVFLREYREEGATLVRSLQAVIRQARRSVEPNGHATRRARKSR
ncbi:MAG: MarR family transcriptional regulator [Hyphomicrobiales bacterium]